MASAAIAVSEPSGVDRFRTVADLQAYLGGIPAHRIRLLPQPGHATEDDVFAVLRKESRICELIDGILVEKAMASFESLVGCLLATYLNNFIEGLGLGVILDAKGYLRLFPGRIRIPDVSFISWKRMPNRKLPKEKVWSLAPDLAVEVLSADNTEGEMELKRQDYFQAGTKLDWIVDPQARTVRVYTSPQRFRLLTEKDTLDGGKVLPGFQLSIKKWFERASEGL